MPDRRKTAERSTQRGIEAMREVEIALRAQIATAAGAIPPGPAGRDDRRIHEVLDAMEGLRGPYEAARSRLRGRAGSDEEKKVRQAATDTIRAWDAITETMRAASDPAGTTLLKPDAFDQHPDPVASKLSAAFRTLEVRLNGESQSAEAQEMGCHPFIPLRPSRYVAFLLAAWRICIAQGRSEAERRFLEIGSGAGTKVALARTIFSETEGLEYDPSYVERAHLVMPEDDPSCRVFQANALEFQGYSDYDIIYAFVPMDNEELQRGLEQRIGAEAREGAIIIAPLSRFFPPQEHLAELAPDLFVKGLDEEGARELTRLARRVGEHPPPPTPSKGEPRLVASKQSSGHFKPLADALAAAGYRWS